jgi:hypothetical protein
MIKVGVMVQGAFEVVSDERDRLRAGKIAGVSYLGSDTLILYYYCDPEFRTPTPLRILLCMKME